MEGPYLSAIASQHAEFCVLRRPLQCRLKATLEAFLRVLFCGRPRLRKFATIGGTQGGFCWGDWRCFSGSCTVSSISCCISSDGSSSLFCGGRSTICCAIRLRGY